MRVTVNAYKKLRIMSVVFRAVSWAGLYKLITANW